MFDVTLDGVAYQEMHVDGGAFAQAFLYPSGAHTAAARAHGARPVVVPAVAYVIRNGRLDPEWATTERSTLGIASRAISTMITASGLNDVVRIYNADAPRRHSVQPGLYRLRLHREAARAVRPGLHAGPVRLRLPACPSWL